MHKRFGPLTESDGSQQSSSGFDRGTGNNRSEGNGQVTSPVDLRAQNLDGDDKENNKNSGLVGGDILNGRNDRESIDDADALLEKIKNGTLGTNFTIPESVEKQLKDKKASLTREYEKERKQLMERMQTLESQSDRKFFLPLGSTWRTLKLRLLPKGDPSMPNSCPTTIHYLENPKRRGGKKGHTKKKGARKDKPDY